MRNWTYLLKRKIWNNEIIMKLKSSLEQSGMGSFYLSIKVKDGKAILQKYGKRVICKINNQQIHCAILNSKSIGQYIMISKAVQKKLKVNYKEEVKFEVCKDDSKYQMEMSEELEEVLKTDAIAEERFHQLTPGKQRSLIHYINKAKNIDTRINRALKISNNLKMGKKVLKELLSN